VVSRRFQAGEKNKLDVKTRRGGEDSQVAENLLGDWIPHGWGDDLPGKALRPFWTPGRQADAGVEGSKICSRQNLSVVTGLMLPSVALPPQGEKSPFCNSAFVEECPWTTFPGCSGIVPGKEEEGLVPAVVQLGNPHWTTQAAPKSFWLIRRPGRLKGRKVIVPRIGV